MKHIAITGVNGFVGKHLVRELRAHDHMVTGISQDSCVHPDITGELTSYYSVDLSLGWPKIKEPIDAIIHLAGLAAVGPSFDHPQDYISINSAIVTNMAEAYLKAVSKPRIILISSGALYDPTAAMPITESSPIAFTSPYTVSKVLIENQAAYYTGRGLECVVMRPFNHIGPGQRPGFLVPDLADKIHKRTGSEPIPVGNLTTRRDYTDVRDVARAYRLVATKPASVNHLIYNVCSGTSHSGEEVLDLVAHSMNIPRPEIMVDESLIRPSDIMDIRGDNTRLMTEFDWKPSYSFDQTIRDFVDSLSD